MLVVSTKAHFQTFEMAHQTNASLNLLVITNIISIDNKYARATLNIVRNGDEEL